MSYDLMVFTPESAPRTRSEFMVWYDKQTKWTEDHSYNDPIVTSLALRNWFMEMINTFPALNGPFAVEDPDSDFVTDYCIGKEVIYVTFAWSIAEQAYEAMINLAKKHNVGFFDASANEGNIFFPGSKGKYEPIDNPGNLSSIQQIKKSAAPGQKCHSVKDIIFSKINLNNTSETGNASNMQKDKRPWWKIILGLK